MRQVFPELVPRRKWRQTERSVRTRDVCLLRGESKYSAPVYRLCRVFEEEEDEHGVVRTVEVEVRGSFASEIGSRDYVGRRVRRIRVGVQRLAVILPVEEQGRDGTEEKRLGAGGHPDSDDHSCSSCVCDREL